MANIRKNAKRLKKTLCEYFGLDDAIALFLLLLGTVYHLFPSPPQFYTDIRSELIGIGLTVLILGNASQYSQIKEKRNCLVLQMGSRDNGSALEAVRQLAIYGWLYDGTLKDANLWAANLTNAILWDAQLEGACFDSAILEGVDFSYAKLERVDFVGSNLQRAVFRSADLKGAFFEQANLQGADLTDTDLSLIGSHGRMNLNGAKYDEYTNWPEGFDPKAAGAVKVMNDYL